MTGKTHRAGGFLCSVVGFAVLKQHGLLLEGVNEGLQWLMMYPFCMWGSVASDLDHNWQSCPMKDPPSYVVNKALHLTAPIQKTLEASGDKKSGLYKFAKTFNASHRSWQTHSDLTLVLLFMLVVAVLNNSFGLGAVDALLLRIVVMGISLGMIAHFILDMLTTDGVKSVILSSCGKGLRKASPSIRFPEKIRFVPKWHCFRTSGAWEEFVNKALKIMNVLAMIYLLWSVLGLSQLFPYQITFN